MKLGPYSLLFKSIALVIITCLTRVVVAADFSLDDVNTNKINKEKWLCKFCPISTSTTVKVAVSVADISNNNEQFGAIIGEHDDHAGAYLNTEINKHEGDSHYRIQAQDIGKDSNAVSLQQSKVDSHHLVFRYRKLNQFGDTKALTPYQNPGNSSLRLPIDWQREPVTTNMPINDFNTFANRLQRESWQLEMEKTFSKNWQTYVDFKVEDKQGVATTGGSILTKSVLMPAAVEQQHQQLNVGSYFHYLDGNVLINYYQSKFDNKHSAQSWQSPFAEVFGNADAGQYAAPPDNQLKQLSFAANYQHNKLHLQTRLSYGRLTQQQQFLPYSINPQLMPRPLPATNLDGEISTFTSYVKAAFKAQHNWRLSVNYHLHDRDNKTQQQEHQDVLTDSVALIDYHQSRPYSFRKEQIKIESQWRFAVKTRLNLGAQIERRERDLQDRKETKEKKVWLKIASHFGPFHTVNLKLFRQVKDGSKYQGYQQGSALAQSLNRYRFNQADKDHEGVKGRISFKPWLASEVSLLGYFSKEQYSKTDIGLVESKRRGVDLSVNVQLSDALSLHAFVHNQWQENHSQGSHWYKDIDWLAINDDKSDSAGLYLVAQKLADGKLTLGSDYTYSYAKGIASIEQLTLDTIARNNVVLVDSQEVKLYADYSYSSQLSLNINYLYQKFDQYDWRLAQPVDGISNVLGNGSFNHNYDASRIEVTMTYQF